jgi:hypothetical protein
MRKLLLAAIVSGFALRLGIPGLGDLITLFWELLHPGLLNYSTTGLSAFVALAGIGVMVLALYLNYGIFLKGLKKGRKGIFIVLLGVALGFLLGSLLPTALAGVPAGILPA